MKDSKRERATGRGDSGKSPRARRSSQEISAAQARAWAFMAAISVSLSDDPIIGRNKKYRHLVDLARKALFDLHGALGRSIRSAASKHPGRRRLHRDVEALVSNLALLWSDAARTKIQLDILRGVDAKRRFGTLLTRVLAGELRFIQGPSSRMAALVNVSDLLQVLTHNGVRLSLDMAMNDKRLRPILRRVIRIKGDRTEKWLNEPVKPLNYQVPAHLLRTQAGTKVFVQFLNRLESRA